MPQAETDNFEPYSAISLIPGAAFYRIDAYDKLNIANARIATKLAAEGAFLFSQHWSRGVTTFQSLRHSRVQFEAPDGKTILNDSTNLTNLSAGFSAGPSESFRFNFAGGMYQQLFARAVRTDVLTLDRHSLAWAGGGLGFRILEAKKMSMDLDLGGRYFLKTKGNTYDMQRGWGAHAKLKYSQSLNESLDIQSTFSVARDTFESTISRQTVLGVGFEMGLTWRL